MTIRRHGSEKNRGSRSIVLSKPKYSINSMHGHLVLNHPDVKGFGASPTKHDYEVIIPLKQLAAMLGFVGETMALQTPEAVSEAFSGSLRSLGRITTVCVGGELKAPPEQKN